MSSANFDDVGPGCDYTVVCVQGVQERAENTALRGSSVSGSVGRRCCYLFGAPAICLLGSPGSSCTEKACFTTSLEGTMVLNAEL